MPGIATRRLTERVGAEVLDVDLERIRGDGSLAPACREALEVYGVLVFRGVGADDRTQVDFGGRLGELVRVMSHPIPEITVISMEPANPLAGYFKGAFQWHIDGSMDEVPCKAGMLSAHVISPGDGGTEFASTYAAYEDLSPAERAYCDGLRVVHTFEASQRPMYLDPTPEQLADWGRRPARVHPLVWRHRNGRRSLVFGATADHIEGLPLDEGRRLLADLLARATRADRILRHDWSVGDLVIWDNPGVIHRAGYYEQVSPRELHRTTIAGEEPIR